MSPRFWSKVDKSGECWIWTAGKFAGGYGCYWDGKSRKAHRVSYEEHFGPIPEGMQIDHTCHNTCCVNPAHLRTVTGKQNCENVRGPQSNGTSGYRGVTWHKRDKRWQAAVTHNWERVHLGYFESAEQANAAAVAKRLELFTHNDTDRNAA
jgi:hypothetical protein